MHSFGFVYYVGPSVTTDVKNRDGVFIVTS